MNIVLLSVAGALSSFMICKKLQQNKGIPAGIWGFILALVIGILWHITEGVVK